MTQRAIILAAGRGTRVQPITFTRAKPMIPVLNSTVMHRLIETLRDQGVRQLVINTSYLAPDIENVFRDGSALGVDIAYSFEGYKDQGGLVDVPLGSAGALRRIQDHSGFFDAPFFVLCGDALIDLDLQDVYAQHCARGALATLVLTPVPREKVSHYGIAHIDAAGHIHGFQEKPSVETAVSNLANTGIYIFDPEIIAHIPREAPYDIGSQLFPALVAAGAPLHGVVTSFQWLDIGTVAEYYQVCQMALRGEVHGMTLPGHSLAPGIHAGLNVSVDLDACEMTPPVYIGGSATIEPGCRIVGPTLIGAGCYIEQHAHIDESIILDYTRVGAQAYVHRLIASGDYCVNADGTMIDVARARLEGIVSDARMMLDTLPHEQRAFLRDLADWGDDHAQAA